MRVSVIFTLKMRKLRKKYVRLRAQGHTVSKPRNQDLNYVDLTLEAVFLNNLSPVLPGKEKG